jgi:hypothetical protein
MNTRTALIGAALAAVAVVLLIVLSGSEDGDEGPTAEKNVSGKVAGGKDGGGKAGDGGKAPAEPAVPTIVVGQDGKPDGGVAELTYRHGEVVRFKVESAVADEIHVHGYDLTKEVEAGGTVSFAFPAEIEGLFEAELEGRGEQILELRINP